VQNKRVTKCGLVAAKFAHSTLVISGVTKMKCTKFLHDRVVPNEGWSANFAPKLVVIAYLPFDEKL